MKLPEAAPEQWKALVHIADSLPPGALHEIGLEPFTGYVANLNVCTNGHTDPEDAEDICVLLMASECSGGELVLYELGLVIELRGGDVVEFRSKNLTHFNLHYQGRRLTFVLHSDRANGGWEDTCNQYTALDIVQ